MATGAAQEVGRPVTISRQEHPTPGSGGSALMRSKLGVPRLPPGVVRRARLMDRISEGVGRRVTLVSAGPGWGKTTLVAAWAAARSSAEPVAWLSLDSFDNDPVLFWSYVTAAIDGTGEVPDGSLGALMIGPPVGEDVVRRILLAVAELPRPLTLVLDDFGEISNRQVLDGVYDLVRHPSPLRLVVVTRSDPSLHLNRLRVAGELLEIRAADLAFTEQESGALLRQAGVSLPGDLDASPSSADRGVGCGASAGRLVCCWQRRPWADRRVRRRRHGRRRLSGRGTVGGTSRGAPQVHVEDVRGEPALCRSRRPVVRRQRRTKELEALEQSNAFVMAIGADHEWFRYHPLLADMLRHRLLVDDPELAPELHRRAAQWFAARGEAVEAVRHAVGAGDWQLVGTVDGHRCCDTRSVGRTTGFRCTPRAGAPQHVRLECGATGHRRGALLHCPGLRRLRQPCRPCARHGEPTRGSGPATRRGVPSLRTWSPAGWGESTLHCSSPRPSRRTGPPDL